MMSDARATERAQKIYKYAMTGLIGFCAFCLFSIIFFPLTHTHEGTLTIVKIETWGDGLYHIRTDKIILNVTGYYHDDLLRGHTYRVKWVDGLRVDRIIAFEELS